MVSVDVKHHVYLLTYFRARPSLISLMVSVDVRHHVCLLQSIIQLLSLLCDQIIINSIEFCYKWYSRNNSSSDNNNTNNDNNNLTLSHEPDVPEGPRDGLW